jgi:hypothetical protein
VAGERSFQIITKHDLRRLVQLALDDLDDLYVRKPHIRKLCKNKFLCLVLCQGAALHYLDRTTGVKDFDVWAFFKRTGARQFPYRRRGVVDFGSEKFGQTTSHPDFVGRSVDLLGRSIPIKAGESPPDSVLRYVHSRAAETPRLLIQKAGILLFPKKYFGQVLWRGPTA